MKFGLNSADWSFLQTIVIGPLKNQGCSVWIFGSRARGTQKEFSDIDLLYEAPAGRELPSGFISSIREQLEESRFNYKVDLVDWADMAASYKASVFADRVPL